MWNLLIYVKQIDVSRSAVGRVFLFSWERMRRGLLEIIVSSNALPEVLGMSYRLKFKYSFTNRGCLYCAILKALYGCQEKRAHKSRDIHFSFEIFKIRFSRFSKCLKTIWNSSEQPAKLPQKWATETKTPHS